MQLEVSEELRLVKQQPGSCGVLLVEDAAGVLWNVKTGVGPSVPHLLANEFIGTTIYERFGLPVPHWKTTWIDAWPPIPAFSKGCRVRAPRPGLYFASEHVPNATGHCVLSLIPPLWACGIRDPGQVLGALLLDHCLGHADQRQTLFVRRSSSLEVLFIDHGEILWGASRKQDSTPVSQMRLGRVALLASLEEGVLDRWIANIEKNLLQAFDQARREVPCEWVSFEKVDLFERIESRVASLRTTADSELEKLHSYYMGKTYDDGPWPVSVVSALGEDYVFKVY